jgi:DNA topoisomerase I
VIDLSDAYLGSIVKRCQELPGQHLFQYLGDDGRRRAVESADVNAYVREVAGADFTAKDFRTWAGTVLAAWALHELATATQAKPSKRSVVRAIEAVAARLGNTTAVCRKCYVHPAVVDAYLDGSLPGTLRGRLTAEARRSGLRADEARVLQLLVARSGTRRLPAAA